MTLRGVVAARLCGLIWGLSAVANGAVTEPAAPAASAARLAPPTPHRERALQVLEGEFREYERSAQEFDAAITDIVRHHYQSRRQRALAALDQELKTESLRVTQAREAAIARLTVFVRTYSGPKAD
ncbi:MAG TPA: hypothetical protein VHO25_02670, partial [Polyangiaceae bacterium]|nr:hypothetical protein [Polyangiaceae bacterium]